jgi:TRAP-type C4-dicarboxylate transport system substrate-binding protein
MLIVNMDFWDRLNDAQKAAIDLAAREAENAAITNAEDAAQQAFHLGSKRGLKMHWQTPDERSAWKEAFQQPVIDGLLSNSSDPDRTREIISLIEKL